MWAVFFRNPGAVLLALMLHLGLAALVIMGNDIYISPPASSTHNLPIQAKVTNIASIRKHARELAKIQARQRKAEVQAQRAASFAQAAVALEQQILKRQAEVERQQTEAAAIAETKRRAEIAENKRRAEIAENKRRAEIARQHAEVAAVVKQQEVVQRQREQMTAAARLQLEFERQQVEAAAEMKRQGEIKRQQVVAKIAGKMKRQVAVKQKEAVESKRQVEMQRQRSESMAAAMQQEEIERNQESIYASDVNNLQSAIAMEQQERDNYELVTLQSQIYEQIRSNWRIPPRSRSLRCTLRVNINVSGEVVSIQVVKSSGNKLFDVSAERAVRRASPLPVPKNKHLFDEFLILEFNPIKD